MKKRSFMILPVLGMLLSFAYLSSLDNASGSDSFLLAPITGQ